MDITTSDATNTLGQQIAALAAALQLPLPEDSRQRLMADIQALQVRQAAHAAGHAAIHGTTDVSGELHGTTIGVNPGTMIYHARADDQGTR